MLTLQVETRSSINTVSAELGAKIVKIAKKLSVFTTDDISVILETPEKELFIVTGKQIGRAHV